MSERFKKGRIIFICSFSMMVFTVLSFLSFQQLREANGIREVDENLEKMHGLSLEIFKTDADFFGYDLNYSVFFNTGRSDYLIKHDTLLHEMRALFKNPIIHQTETDNQIEVLVNRYDSLFNVIVKMIKARGYFDYGLEGSMRSVALQIEKGHYINAVDYLTLRRYEKNFLLRSDKIYANKFDSLMSRLEVGASKPASDLLMRYSDAFHEFAKLSDEIGLETQTNLKGKLDQITHQLISEINIHAAKQDEIIFNTYQKGLILLVIGIIGSAILSVILIIIIARRL